MPITIRDLKPADTTLIEHIAAILVAAFGEHWPNAWPDITAGLEEVYASLEEGRISRVAVKEDGSAVGWIGGIPAYETITWELHPLAVDPNQQKQGIGRALVLDLEEQVKQRGGMNITLGSDDEDEMTSLAGVDLYQNIWEHIANIRNIKGHPYSFYQKLGYAITGVIPDANGPGKPDILMCKRLYPAS